MAQQAKTPAASLSSILGHTWWQARTGSSKLFSDLHTHAVAHTHTHNTHSLNKCKFFHVYWSFLCMYVSAPC